MFTLSNAFLTSTLRQKLLPFLALMTFLSISCPRIIFSPMDLSWLKVACGIPISSCKKPFHLVSKDFSNDLIGEVTQRYRSEVIE